MSNIFKFVLELALVYIIVFGIVMGSCWVLTGTFHKELISIPISSVIFYLVVRLS